MVGLKLIRRMDYGGFCIQEPERSHSVLVSDTDNMSLTTNITLPPSIHIADHISDQELFKYLSSVS